MRHKYIWICGIVWLIQGTSSLCIGGDFVPEWMVDGQKLTLLKSSEPFTGKGSIKKRNGKVNTFEIMYERLTYSLAKQDDSGNHQVLWKTEFTRELDPRLRPVGYELRIFDIAGRKDKLFILLAKPNMIRLDVVSMDDQDQSVKSYTLIENSVLVLLTQGGRLLLTGLDVNALLDIGDGRLDLWTVRKGKATRLWTQLNEK